ncbi:fluoride efflux transporter FluC [Paenactinomyces guangxiensis]|uniref:Fluoride-specific ion channel FluC n=1 Tax=Paenactinomyces guangxiensis TaxID=1490290 RepID=A0A7W1WT93_9BACL|nr:CrcB family protein [Paenactinomyces guangxiensis]MBA4495416.1 CrcB family protein [Paenactinomyces guangxiensis]MBH8592463.1 CrcB family protein [Paenactinomyces guangxiensis]
MKQICFVGVGGFIGTLLRFAVSRLLHQPGFPWGTLFVNWTGCFLLAWLLAVNTRTGRISPEWQTGLGTGLLGSYTTFSAFSAETIQLGNWKWQAVYVAVSVIGGIALAVLGRTIGKEKR